MKKFVFWVMISMVVCGSLSSCKKEKRNAPMGQETKQETLAAPPFNADSAFHFVKAQTDFGPRVPNTTAHDRCGEYLQKTLAKYADTLYVQSFSAKNYKGTQLRGRNIIGVFNPDQTRRVILASHWDSRHVADHDPDPANHTTPIDGANDGASGVGVLLEIARQLAEISFSSTWKTTVRPRVKPRRRATGGASAPSIGPPIRTSPATAPTLAFCWIWWATKVRCSATSTSPKPMR